MFVFGLVGQSLRDEEVEVLADKELGIRHQLTGAQTGLAVPELLLEPNLRKPRRRQRFDVADRVQTADQAAVWSAAAVHLKAVGIEAQAVEAREPAEIDADHRLQLAVEDRAAPNAASQVRQQLGGVNEAERHPMRRKPAPRAERIAVGRQAARNRRHGRHARRRIALRTCGRSRECGDDCGRRQWPPQGPQHLLQHSAPTHRRRTPVVDAPAPHAAKKPTSMTKRRQTSHRQPALKPLYLVMRSVRKKLLRFLR